ncbi:DinB family protein [Negadavirga shengliensis]|uniref:DinB family protein n=1 Tax=Negadavirga shengliensis TaxID=1389218 RepID=A0ABV9T2X3_9BACT
MDRSYFKDLLAYNHHYNQKLVEIFLKESTDEKSLQLFCHMLNAHHIWNARINGKKAVYSVWETHPVSRLQAMDKKNYEDSLALLDKVDTDQTISYTTSKGDAFENRIIDILFHIINHSTYHRGQIALLFRQTGLEPLISDYVFYKR